MESSAYMVTAQLQPSSGVWIQKWRGRTKTDILQRCLVSAIITVCYPCDVQRLA